MRSNFINLDEMEDNLGLSKAVNEAISLYASRGSRSRIIFFDSADYAPSCKLSGVYSSDGTNITLNMKMRCGDESSSMELSASSIEELAKSIVIEAKK